MAYRKTMEFHWPKADYISLFVAGNRLSWFPFSFRPYSLFQNTPSSGTCNFGKLKSETKIGPLFAISDDLYSKYTQGNLISVYTTRRIQFPVLFLLSLFACMLINNLATYTCVFFVKCWQKMRCGLMLKRNLLIDTTSIIHTIRWKIQKHS